MITIGSLFSGIGGLELGLERAGLGPVLWQCEIDPWCRKVLAHHWPDATRYSDVRDMVPPQVDLICGGFPCVDISAAGRKEGIQGADSSLWFDMLNIVRMVRPRYVVVENVSALLVRGMDTVLSGLSESGYDALWDCISAEAIGAPHLRERLFLIAWKQREQWEPRRRIDAAELPDCRHLFKNALANGNGRGCEGQRQSRRFGGGREQGQRGHQFDGRSGETEAVGDSDCTGPQGRTGAHQRGAKPGNGRATLADPNRLSGGQGQHQSEIPGRNIAPGSADCWPPRPNDVHAWGRVSPDTQPAICRLADGLPAGLLRDRRRRLKALGNAVVPAVAEVVGRVVLQLDAQLGLCDSPPHDDMGRRRPRRR